MAEIGKYQVAAVSTAMQMGTWFHIPLDSATRKASRRETRGRSFADVMNPGLVWVTLIHTPKKIFIKIYTWTYMYLHRNIHLDL